MKMRGLAAKAVLLALCMPVLACAADCTLEYRFTANWDAQPRRFDVELLFDAGDRSATQIRSVREWAGVTDFERAIRDVRPGDPTITLSEGSEPGKTRKVVHPPKSRVSVRYAIVNDVENVDADTPMPHRDFYRNMLGASYFQLFGWAVLLLPEHLRDDLSIPVCMTFSGLAPGWSFASSHGEGQAGGVASIRTNASPLALRSAIYLGGDFRVHRRDIEDRPLFVALRGAWKFDDAKLVDGTAAVVRSHREFWNDYDFSYYLISLLPNRFAQGSMGGTGLTNSFAMHAPKDFDVPGPAFDTLIAHEHVHTWIPRRIGTMGEDEALRYWFSEGFTDYLTHRLLVKSGVWTLDDYAKSLNALVLRYQASRARNVSNATVLQQFWKDPLVQRIPYLRGELIALRWSGAMAARDRSLEATLRSLRRDASVPREEFAKRPEDLAVNRLVSALRQDLGPAIDRDVETLVEAGGTIPMRADFLGPCFSGKPVSKPRFELGFDFASFEAKKVTNLVPGSAAEKAGIYEGMPLAGWSVYGGDVEKEAMVQVKEGEVVRNITYMPHAPQGLETYEFAAIPDGSRQPACRRWIEAR